MMGGGKKPGADRKAEGQSGKTTFRSAKAEPEPLLSIAGSSVMAFIEAVSALGEPVALKVDLLEKRFIKEMRALESLVGMIAILEMQESALRKLEGGIPLERREEHVWALIKLQESISLFKNEEKE